MTHHHNTSDKIQYFQIAAFHLMTLCDSVVYMQNIIYPLAYQVQTYIPLPDVIHIRVHAQLFDDNMIEDYLCENNAVYKQTHSKTH